MTTTGGAEVAIVGGGFSGSLLALKLIEAGIHPVLIEPAFLAGPGLAYGAADAMHVLNVTVQRMEVGLEPSFTAWLAKFPEETAEAVLEAGELSQAFVPRHLFGKYLAEQVQTAVREHRLSRLRGEVVRVLHLPGDRYELTLDDGRRIKTTRLVLATGNLPPRPPPVRSTRGVALQDVRQFVPAPWKKGALDAVAADDDLLLIGTGLTMVDVALSLRARGHAGTIYALSRRGFLPRAHRPGGSWPAFLGTHAGRSPLQLLRVFRAQFNSAVKHGVPWQRVIDAARPDVAQIWSSWTSAQRRQFLRHARAIWDVHRHRLAPRIGEALTQMRGSGRFETLAGRLLDFEIDAEWLRIAVRERHRRDGREILVDHVINCTGPASDLSETGVPLFLDLAHRGLVRPDALGLGLETSDARVIDAGGKVSRSLFALGPLTRPAWWEVTAVPEIAAQAARLVTLLSDAAGTEAPQDSMARVFSDLGAGI